MSVIKLEISVDASNIEVVKSFLDRISNAEAKGIKVNGAEVIETNPANLEEEKPKKPAGKKPAVKKAPEPEIEEEEEFEIEEEEEEEQVINLEGLKALQATKVVEHKAAIVAKFKKYGAARLSDVDPKHYADYEKFLNGLK